MRAQLRCVLQDIGLDSLSDVAIQKTRKADAIGAGQSRSKNPATLTKCSARSLPPSRPTKPLSFTAQRHRETRRCYRAIENTEWRRMQGVQKDDLNPLIPQFDEDHADFNAGYLRTRPPVTVDGADDVNNKPSNGGGHGGACQPPKS